MKLSNIEKRMTSGGPETPRLNFNELIADAEKFEFDALNEKLELLREAWLEQREPGETYESWFKRTPRDTIIRLTMGSGGKVIKFSDFKKPKKTRRGIHSKNLSRGKHSANYQYKKPYNRQGR